MMELDNCYFCGAKAPALEKERGVYKLHCSCGAVLEYIDKDMLYDMWNYMSLKEEEDGE